MTKPEYSHDENRVGQDDSSLKGILSIPSCYRLLQESLGASRVRKMMIERLLEPASRECVLDLGCGTGELLASLPDGVIYVGVDISEKYIECARGRFDDRGEFAVMDVRDPRRALKGRTFNAVAGLGVLHHLNDAEVAAMLDLAWECLEPGGRFVSVDPCFAEGQHRFARYMIRHDRGRCVRDEAGYRERFSPERWDVRSEVFHNLLRIPYTHCFMTCVKTQGPALD